MYCLCASLCTCVVQCRGGQKRESDSPGTGVLLELEFQMVWNASRICMPSLRSGHADLSIVPILVYMLPKRALKTLFLFVRLERWLRRALVALAEDPGLIPSSHMATNNCNSSSGDPMPSPDLFGHCMTWVHLHTCRQYTHTHKNNF